MQTDLEIFNPYEEDWDSIQIHITKGKDNCYIRRKDNKGNIIKKILLSNRPQVKVYCEWTFYPSSRTGKFIPRPKFYKTTADNLIKSTDKQRVIIDIDDQDLPIKFWDMVTFFNLYKDLIELGEFGEKYNVAKVQLINTFNKYDDNEKIQTISEMIKDKDFSYYQLEPILANSKEKSLKKFEKMLASNDTSEKDWQNFFEENIWIFAGISLKLIFNEKIITQADIGISNTQGKGSPIVDMLCINKYSTLVELKKHNTPIFTDKKRNTARTDTWSFSSEFIDGISQCLAQKQEFIKTSKQICDTNGEIVTTRIQYPKSIFIIGNLSNETKDLNKKVIDSTKADTFENFRQNNKHIDIITFDELYERAKFIVDNLSK